MISDYSYFDMKSSQLHATPSHSSGFRSQLTVLLLFLSALSGFAQVEGLGLGWSVLTSFSGTSSPTSEARSMRSLALSSDDSVAYVGFLQGTSSSAIRKIDATTGAVLGSLTIASSRQPKAAATDDRGYVYFSTARPTSTTDGQFRVYDQNLNLLQSFLPAGTQRIGGICLKRVGGTYLLYVAREASSSALIERYDVTDYSAIFLDTTFAAGGQLDLRTFFPTAANLTGIEVDDDGTIFQTSRDADAIYRISANSLNASVATVPRAMDVAIRGARLYVTHYDSANSKVSVLNKSDLSFLCFLPTGISRSSVSDSGYAGIDITADGRIYLADQVYNNTPSTLVQDRILTSTVLPDEPIFGLQPQNFTGLIGTNFTHSITVAGTQPIALQWFFSSSAIPGATTDTLTVENAITNDSGAYFVIASNIAGFATSSVATVTIIEPVGIVENPQSRTNIQGTTASFSVIPSGSEPITYQWFFQDNPLTLETNSNLILPSVQLTDAGGYHVVLSNAGGMITSAVATLTVIADGTAPTVKVSTPKSKVSYLAPTLSFTGTAQDNLLVQSVTYNLNNSGFVSAILSHGGTASNWTTLPATLSPGTNTLSVIATDSAGNSSSPVNLVFYYNTKDIFHLNTNGTGIVVATASSLGTPTNGASLLVGRPYRLTAKQVPASNWILTNWTDESGIVLQGSEPILNFVMRSNLTITANFITNPFVRHAGIYNGLFFQTNGVSHESAGYITFKVNKTLGYTGKLLVNGDSVPFSGRFLVDGSTGTKTISRLKKGKSSLTLSFALDFAEASDTASGTVADGSTWTSVITADRVVWTKVPPAHAIAYTNAYTLAIPGFTNHSEGPVGYSHAKISVNYLGKIQMAGRMSDQHKLKQTTYVSKNGSWPFFSPMYVARDQIVSNGSTTKTNKQGHGAAIGWLTFLPNTNAATTNLAPQGEISWIKSGWTNSYWTNGFTNQATVVSSRHLPPLQNQTTNIYNFTNALLVMSEGNLNVPFTNSLFLKTNTAFVVSKPPVNDLKAAIARKTGLLSGSFKHADNTNAVTKWAGVMLQDYNFGMGSFLGTNEGGIVELFPLVP